MGGWGGAWAGTGKFRNQLKMKTRGHRDHLGDDGWAGLTVGSSGDCGELQSVTLAVGAGDNPFQPLASCENMGDAGSSHF